MKLEFKNYNYQFDKVEKKFLIQFCKQTLNQMPQQKEYIPVGRVFESIQNKLEDSIDGSIKFTKDELTKFEYSLKENLKLMDKQLKTSGFFKRFFLKAAVKQYRSIVEKHFSK